VVPDLATIRASELCHNIIDLLSRPYFGSRRQDRHHGATDQGTGAEIEKGMDEFSAIVFHDQRPEIAVSRLHAGTIVGMARFGDLRFLIGAPHAGQVLHAYQWKQWTW
jgi:hypothetical protein